nr:nitrilase-related carbon-nitrogen hydrolase [Kocuria atrinae]
MISNMGGVPNRSKKDTNPTAPRVHVGTCVGWPALAGEFMLSILHPDPDTLENMRIAIGQILSSHDPQENLVQVQELAARAGQDGADVLVLPEATMFAFGRSLKNVAEPVDGPWGQAVSAAAQKHGVGIVAGMFSPGDEDRVRNTAVIALADGRVLSYDKTHLYDAFGFKESDTVQAGAAPVTFDLGDVTVGVATCYDIRFPALFTRMAADGAQVVLLGASWGDGPGKVEQWELLARARAWTRRRTWWPWGRRTRRRWVARSRATHRWAWGTAWWPHRTVR